MAESKELGRKVVTFYGERLVESTPLEDALSLERGYSVMNERIAQFAQVATIHSVSHAPLVFPDPHGSRVWLYAAIVYSGTTDPVDFFHVPRNSPETHGWNIETTQTVL
ncbi:MAG TPA: hypothetical protein VFV38_11465 [Ktedonobacteraceae bacterium]|nr:hypothetical protein [Ktedonobacteraceae bacterium]